MIESPKPRADGPRLNRELLLLPPHDFQLALQAASLLPFFQTLPEPYFTAIISSTNNDDSQAESTHNLLPGSLARRRNHLIRHFQLPGEHSLVIYAVLADQIEVNPLDQEMVDTYAKLPKDTRDAFERVADAMLYQTVKPQEDLDDSTKEMALRAGADLDITTSAEFVTIWAVQKQTQNQDKWIDTMRSAVTKLATHPIIIQEPTDAAIKTARGKYLTPRLQEVAELVAQGLNNKEISERLYLSEVTVKNYVSLILYKLFVGRRSGIASAVVRSNLLSREDTQES